MSIRLLYETTEGEMWIGSTIYPAIDLAQEVARSTINAPRTVKYAKLKTLRVIEIHNTHDAPQPEEGEESAVS